jgi:hypothetical protein
MASEAYKNYLINLKDVDRLIESHANESGSSKGKKGLGHITRSGVVMLCAAFEVFVEELVEETIEIYINSFPSFKEFPKQCRKRFATLVMESKNELEMLGIAGDGWKDMLRTFVRRETGALNTPKTEPVNVLVNRFIGIADFSTKWSPDCSTKLNDFVSTRGEIAHNGSKAIYVKIKYLKESRDFVTSLCQEIDTLVCDKITEITPGNAQPWRKRY